MLPPDRTTRLTWDLVSLFIILVECFCIPISMAFVGADIMPSFWVWSVIAFFTVDIILNFYTGFQYRGIMVSSLQISGVRYLTSVWIWVDVISTVPWDKMLVVDEKTEFARLLRIQNGSYDPGWLGGYVYIGKLRRPIFRRYAYRLLHQIHILQRLPRSYEIFN